MARLATSLRALGCARDADGLADIDLFVLGAPVAEYDAFERAIREEYAFVPAELYALGRAAILQSFLVRSAVYTTAPVRALREAPARANLARAVLALGEGDETSARRSSRSG